MFTPDNNDLKIARSIIRKYGSRAISEADARLRWCAERGDKDAAMIWMRVTALVEFDALRSNASAGENQRIA